MYSLVKYVIPVIFSIGGYFLGGSGIRFRGLLAISGFVIGIVIYSLVGWLEELDRDQIKDNIRLTNNISKLEESIDELKPKRTCNLECSVEFLAKRLDCWVDKVEMLGEDQVNNDELLENRILDLEKSLARLQQKYLK